MYKNRNTFSENDTHKGAKHFMTAFLIGKGWRLKSNTINGEYWIHQELGNGHKYRLDGYFISPDGKHYGIEYDGLYHFGSSKQFNRMINKDIFVTGYFKKIGIDIKIVRFRTEELCGKAKLSNEVIYSRIINR